MPNAKSHKSIDHDEIKKWVESRKGKPSKVVGTESGGSEMLRIDFPGYEGKGSLEPIEWEEFFRIFEERKLALLYQEKTASGRQSRFCKLVNR